jgi:hypothetical protein
MTREELIKKRADDLLALVAELGTSLLGLRGEFTPSHLPPDVSPVSARELEWLLAPGTTTTATLRIRQVGPVPFPRATVTAPYTFEKLNVSYVPRNFLVGTIDRARLSVCVAYVAGRTRFVPATPVSPST